MLNTPLANAPSNRKASPQYDHESPVEYSLGVALDYSLRIKARSRALQNFLIQLACARGTYLPTRRAIQGKHYGAGAADNLVGPEGGQILVNRTVDLINGMWGEEETRGRGDAMTR